MDERSILGYVSSFLFFFFFLQRNNEHSYTLLRVQITGTLWCLKI